MPSVSLGAARFSPMITRPGALSSERLIAVPWSFGELWIEDRPWHG